MAPLLRPAFPACLCRVYMQFTCFVIFPAADVLLGPGPSALALPTLWGRGTTTPRGMTDSFLPRQLCGLLWLDYFRLLACETFPEK